MVKYLNKGNGSIIQLQTKRLEQMQLLKILLPVLILIMNDGDIDLLVGSG
jgi:hypothetical protein